MAIYNINYLNEGFFNKEKTKVSLEDAKKARDILKKILRNMDIDAVRRTIEPSNDAKIEKAIKKGKDPVIALYKPITDYQGQVDKKANPTNAELNLLKDDFDEALDREGLNYTSKWGMTLFGKGLSIK